MYPIRRAIHFDFHTMPGIYNFGEHFDADAFAQSLADADVDYINFFAQCNLGFAYYPTKVGIPYPTMQGDLLGEVVRACHERNIGVTAYVNVGLMHEQANLHPEWLRVNREGKIYRGDRVSNNFFRTMCYNQPGYRAFLLALLREVCDLPVDGLFCDCMHFFPCHCPACTRDMLAQGINPDDEAAALAFSKRVMLSLCEEIKAMMGERRVFFNGMPMYLFRNLDSHFEIECLPSGGWGYDFLGARAAYARNLYGEVLYMTGRFQAGWGDFGGYKGRASLENDLFEGLMNNLKPSIGDHLHPAENLEKDIYADVGAIYRRIRAYEPYTQGAKYFSDIGVLTASEGQLGHEYAGLARMFGELKQSFDIVHQDMDLSRFRVLVLPDSMTVDAALAKKLRDCLKNGTALLMSGFGGLTPDHAGFALPEYDFEFRGSDASRDDYFSFAHTPDGLADMRWATYAGGVRVGGRAEEIRATRIKPYFEKHYDGLHGYFYTPPECETGDAAALLKTSPAPVARVSFAIFEAYFDAALTAHKRLIGQLLEELLPAPLLRPISGLPSTARASLTGKDGYALLHVKVTFPEPRGKLSVVEEHVTLPTGARIAVRGSYTSARVLPNGASLPVERAGEYAIVTLAQITGYDMILLR